MDKLDFLLKTAPRVKVQSAVVVSDLHLGDGTEADNFRHVEKSFTKLAEYASKSSGSMLVIAGDMFDLWQFERHQIVRKYPALCELLFSSQRVIMLNGNHDDNMMQLQAVVVGCGTKQYFVTHGHQGDLMSDKLNNVSRWLVRNVWTPLERMGIKEPPEVKNKHISHEYKLVEWANKQNMDCIFGHTHHQMHRDKYWNAGCQVGGEVEYAMIDSRGISLTSFPGY